MKFKIGDKVKVLNHGSINVLEIGSIETVEDVSDDGEILSLENFGRGWFYENDWFKLVDRKNENPVYKFLVCIKDGIYVGSMNLFETERQANDWIRKYAPFGGKARVYKIKHSHYINVEKKLRKVTK